METTFEKAIEHLKNALAAFGAVSYSVEINHPKLGGIDSFTLEHSELDEVDE